MDIKLVERRASDEARVHWWANLMLKAGMQLVSITLNGSGGYVVYATGTEQQIKKLDNLEIGKG